MKISVSAWGHECLPQFMYEGEHIDGLREALCETYLCIEIALLEPVTREQIDRALAAQGD